MDNNIASKKKNVAIELWRFLIAIAIIGFHTGWIIARSCNGANGFWMKPSNWFFGSSEVLLIFTVTAGFFMAAHFFKRKNDAEYMARSASSRAWEYTWNRVKSLLPVLVLGYLLSIFICTRFYYPDYTMQDIWVMSVNSIWEFLGFHSVGLRSSGNQFFNLNGPLWFISAIIIIGYFMYWALCKNEDFFCGVAAPFLAIFFAGWWAFTGTRAAQTGWSTFGLQTASTNGMGGGATDSTATLGFNNGLVFVMIGMMIGIICYHMIKKLSDLNYSGAARTGLTALNVIVSALLLWYTINQPTYFKLDRWTVAFLCIVLIVLSLLNKDWLTALLNNGATNKLFGYLGSISLYIYMLHYPVAILVLRILGPNTEATTYSFWQVFLPTAGITLVLSVLVNEIMKRTMLRPRSVPAK